MEIKISRRFIIAPMDRALLSFSFFLYLLLMSWIIALKCNWQVPISDCIHVFTPMSIPERIAAGYIRNFEINSFFANKDVLLNIIIFIPLGIYLPLIFGKENYLRDSLLTLCLTVIYETVQLVSCIGAFTFSDILANTLGGVLGLLIFLLCIRYFPDFLVRKINLAVILLGTPIAVYAVINTVVHLDIYFYSTYIS